jgi:hypothetical protein
MTQRNLLLTDDQLQRLRDVGGEMGERRERLIASAETLIDEPVAQPDPESLWGGHLQCANKRMGTVQQCALAYLLTDRDEFYQRAKATVDAILEWEMWSDPCHTRPERRYTLMTGVVTQTLAHYLDWCAAAIDEDEIDRIADHNRQKAVEPMLHDMERPAPFFRVSVNNWVSVMVGGAGLMALLLIDREPFYEHILERCVYHLRRYFTWVNDDGSTNEGGNYWAFGMEHALPLMEALRLRGDDLPASLRWRHADRLHEIPKIRQPKQPTLTRTGYFPLYCIQGDTYVVNFGDTHLQEASRMEAPLRCLARLFEDPHLQWLADRVQSDSPLGLIWTDLDLPAEPPAQLQPSRAFHGAGWGILRSDLEDPEGFLLAVRAGDNAMTHTHRDLGTFILRDGGRGLIVDPGCPVYSADYWVHGKFTYAKETIGHNCVLIDGEGQTGGMDKHAEITRLEDLGDRKYMTVEVRAEENGLTLHRRAFEVTLDESTTVNIADEVTPTRPALVTWLLHYDPEAQIEVREDCITIHNGPATLNICAEPDAPVSVRVEDEHEVPFVAIETAAPVEHATLELACTVTT